MSGSHRSDAAPQAETPTLFEKWRCILPRYVYPYPYCSARGCNIATGYATPANSLTHACGLTKQATPPYSSPTRLCRTWPKFRASSSTKKACCTSSVAGTFGQKTSTEDANHGKGNKSCFGRRSPVRRLPPCKPPSFGLSEHTSCVACLPQTSTQSNLSCNVWRSWT